MKTTAELATFVEERPPPAAHASDLRRDARMAILESHEHSTASPVQVHTYVEAWGRSPLSPFHLGPDRELTGQSGIFGTGFMVRGRWAVMATDVATAPGLEQEGLGLALEALARRRLRPTFAAVTDPSPYQRHGLWTAPVADDALIDLQDFDLSGKRRASVRHSVTSAGRSGLRVVAWSEEVHAGAGTVSDEWLGTKRGGEMGFTLGRFDDIGRQGTDCRVAVDADDRVVGFVTWHRFHGGQGRVLDQMRRLSDAPNPTMDLLIADGLREFAEAGVAVASLGCVPRSFGAWAERVYPTRSLRRYKAKFGPRWEPRHLVAPSAVAAPGALRAVARCFVPGGLLGAAHRNG